MHLLKKCCVRTTAKRRQKTAFLFSAWESLSTLQQKWLEIFLSFENKSILFQYLAFNSIHCLGLAIPTRIRQINSFGAYFIPEEIGSSFSLPESPLISVLSAQRTRGFYNTPERNKIIPTPTLQIYASA